MAGTADLLFGVVAIAGIFASWPQVAIASDAADSGSDAEPMLEQIIVTAQKRQENINNVGMSIQAATGDELTKLGITDPGQLEKIVPGFTYTPSYQGTPVYSIRGIGFHDIALASSPTVSVYLDEVPLPFSSMTLGAPLDAQRVEVLKGPQGTLFGQNATGGAVNYVANKPTDTFHAGADVMYGRFNTTDLTGFVSGPISDTLEYRVAIRSLQGDAWQYSFTRPDTSGVQEFYSGRGILLWKPTETLRVSLTVSGWQDRGDTQIPQIYGIAPLSQFLPVDPRVANYPKSPRNDRAADWNDCVNNSPLDPPFNVGAPFPAGTAPIASTSCVSHRKNNRLGSGSLRIEYDLPSDMTLTSLTSYEHFNLYNPGEDSGVIEQNLQTIFQGNIRDIYQELRLAGTVAGGGNWIVGGNYESSKSIEHSLASSADTSANDAFGYDVETSVHQDYETSNAYAGFANVQYPISDTVTLQAGARFTQTNIDYHGCLDDSGNGFLGAISQGIQNLLEPLYHGPGAVTGQGVLVPPYGCATVGPPPTYNPPANGGVYAETLDQNNVAWRTGVNWEVVPDTLLYVNASQGYKSGSFPSVASLNHTQLAPVRQESLRAYEIGFKSSLFERKLQLNGAGFYYDYTNKQILGYELDPVFGPQQTLVNVPKSHVVGFELSAVWAPMRGLTITPGVSYQSSRVDNCSATYTACAAFPASAATNNPALSAGQFHNFDTFGQLASFTGQRFPYAPLVQADVDVQYEWNLVGGVKAFVGANVDYSSATTSSFTDNDPSSKYSASLLDIPSRALLDLRAGISKDRWRLQLWGRNVLDRYYWTQNDHGDDTLVHFTGMPATFGLTATYRY